MRSATDKVVQTTRDGISTSVSINLVTEIPIEPLAAQSSVATGGETQSGATITGAATGDGTTVQDSKETNSVKENEEENVVEKLVGHSRTETGIQYRAR